MSDYFGLGWEKQQVPGDTRQQWKEKRATALEKKEEEQPIIAYADFTDYEKIIVQNKNWEAVFKPIFRSKIDIQVSLQRLYPIRIQTMHAREITKEDFLLLTVEVNRILRAIEDPKSGDA
jgi:hypothetical protein